MNNGHGRAKKYKRRNRRGASGKLSPYFLNGIVSVVWDFGWLFPEARMGLLFIPVMIPARIFVAIYAAFELFFGVTGFAFDNVAHFAHLGGMIFGAVILWVWQKQGKLY